MTSTSESSTQSPIETAAVVAHDAALAHVRARRFELRLHEHDRLPPRRAQPQDGRKREPHRDEGDVTDGELRRERELAEGARVRPLEHRHARVVAETRMELAVADVERDHARGAAPEQDVGEAAGRRADVDAAQPRGIDAEEVEPVRELLPAARDVLRPTLDDELGVVRHLLAGLVVAANEPGHHERLCLGARLREPTLDEHDVEPLLHRRTATYVA